MTFGEKLKSLRQQNGITQDELADKRRADRENATAYIVSRVAIAAVFLLAAVTLLIELFA